MSNISRRLLMKAGLAVTGGAAGLAAVSKLADQYGLLPPDGSGIYGPGASLNYAARKLLVGNSLARELPPGKISKKPYAQGSPPKDEIFKFHQNKGFTEWSLNVGGMVARPTTFSIQDLKSYPSRSQITQLTCEEGWCYTAQWTGVPLAHVLNLVGVAPQAKYLVYATLPIKQATWDSIDIDEALHPQTLISYAMNGEELPVGFGGPLRMRVPRQLGYKSVKFLASITVTDSLKGFGKGLGSMDAEYGYSWYAGI